MKTLPPDVQTFLSRLKVLAPDANPQVEAGGEKLGNWWLDLDGANPATVEWRPLMGFGLSIGGQEGYGEGPAEIYRTPERAVQRVLQLIAPSRSSKLIGLRALRELYGVTQDQIAHRLNKRQAAISRLENRDDTRIETISEFVTALGGKIEVRAVFPDGELPIYQSHGAPAGGTKTLVPKVKRKPVPKAGRLKPKTSKA